MKHINGYTIVSKQPCGSVKQTALKPTAHTTRLCCNRRFNSWYQHSVFSISYMLFRMWSDTATNNSIKQAIRN